MGKKKKGINEVGSQYDDSWPTCSHTHEILKDLHGHTLFVMTHLLTHLLLLLSNRAGNIALRLHHLVLDL